MISNEFNQIVQDDGYTNELKYLRFGDMYVVKGSNIEYANFFSQFDIQRLTLYGYKITKREYASLAESIDAYEHYTENQKEMKNKTNVFCCPNCNTELKLSLN